MADVFTRRCPCGAILRARQSCERCATAARARLHAAGVATRESETLRIVKRVGRDPNELHEKSARDICNAAVRSGELVAGTMPLDKLHAAVRSGLAAKLEQQKREVERAVQHPEAMRMLGVDWGHSDKAVVVHATVFPGGTYRIHDHTGLAKHEPPTTGASDANLRALVGAGVRYSPPVGAEVPWSVALADMQRREEARYRSSEERYEYRFAGAFEYRTGSHVPWYRNLNTEAYQNEQRWTRIA